MELKTIAQKLRDIRKHCGFTQQQVAAVLKIDRSTYTYYETGKTSPDIPTLKTLAALFNVSVGELLTDETGTLSPVSETDEEPAAEDNTLPERANKLTRTEREAMLYFRALNAEERKRILQTMRDAAHRQTADK